MRYWKGSIALSSIRDYPLLRQVLRSTFISHGQLYEFMRLEYCATSHNAFNNRVLRLVKHDYLVRDEVPFRTDGYVYSISARGAAELAGLGEYYIGLPRRPADGQLPKTVYHAIDLNEIHLALKSSEQLVNWTPDTEIRSRNEFTDRGYRKDYDAVVTVCSNGSERTFALEYERTAKARKEYLRIKSEIEAESSVARFLYLVPNYDLLSYVASFFATSRLAGKGHQADYGAPHAGPQGGCSSVWYPQSNDVAGALPACFFVDGSQDLLVTHNLYEAEYHGCRPHPRRSVRRASGFVLASYPEVERRRGRWARSRLGGDYPDQER